MNRTGVAHSLAFGGATSGDKAENGLGDVFFDESGCFFFICAANFTNHDNGFGVVILLEGTNDINKVHARYRIAAA